MTPPQDEDNKKIYHPKIDLTRADLGGHGEKPIKEDALSLNEVEVLLDFDDLTKIINDTLKKIQNLESIGDESSGGVSLDSGEAFLASNDPKSQIALENHAEGDEKDENQCVIDEALNLLQKEAIPGLVGIDGDFGVETEEEADVDPELLNDFLVETKDHLQDIEMNALALENNPSDREMIHSLFRSFHTIKGLAGYVNLDLVREIAHKTETQLDKCRKGEVIAGKSFIDLILTSADYLKKICENLTLNKDKDLINQVSDHLEKLSNSFCSSHSDKMPDQIVDNETARYEEVKAEKQATNISAFDIGNATYTRVSINKVDNLVDMIGEFVIIQSQIEQDLINRLGVNDIVINKLQRIGKISKDVQNLSISLRMISFKSTFQKINRIARDTIQELKKNVCLEILGYETEVDRGVAERILDPLLHLVKNSISHGIEDESQRIAKGKPVQGKVRIRASSKRGNVYVEVVDDGNGINLERVRQKAIERKLIDSKEEYTEEELLNLIFLPGFSTVENIDNISGRGVGLDVVKTEVSRIGGKVDIFNSPGEGCSFILKIPINLAAINGTIVNIGGERYIIPTLYIKQIVKPEKEQWINVQGSVAMVRLKDQIVPIIPLKKILGISEALGELLVILELEQTFKALPVTNIIDRREIVVKPLESDYLNINFASGASILGDGRVSLILDVENLFKLGEAMSVN